MSVSVVIPAWNAQRYLGAALESVFAQTIQPLEVIVVDDASTDQTAAVARAYPVRLESIAKSGAATARNKGIAVAQGEFIALLDADDLWLPNKLELQLGVFAQQPNLNIVFTAIEQFISPDTPEVALEVKLSAEVLCLPSCSTLMARRRVFELVGELPAIQGGDVMLWLSLAKQQGWDFEMLNSCLAKRRIHQTNLTRIQKNQVQQDYFYVLRQHLRQRKS